jgi:hypothetical protein
MAKVNDTRFCDGCGIEITCAPVVKNGLIYCCQDCADGLPCQCEALLEEDDRRKNYPAMTPG